MRITLEPGYILHHRPYRDTSVLLEVFTAAHGRVGLVARGARSSRSALRAVLQPFQPLLLSWSGRGELATLTHAELAAVVAPLAGRLLLDGYYLNELLQRLVHRHEPHEALYQAYDQTLLALRDGAPEARTLRLFEKRLLQELGYGLMLDHDVDGAPLGDAQHYDYRLDQGPVPLNGAADSGLVVSGSSLRSLAREELLDADSQRDAKRLMRAVLQHQLGDRPLKSRSLFMPPAASR